MCNDTISALPISSSCICKRKEGGEKEGLGKGERAGNKGKKLEGQDKNDEVGIFHS